ncbi:hypothetical protein SFSGTM_11690 [Sulfuriferula nivalis]|uniref:Uncharacterized protein n=1 Tax=Sulfuriferula nivalis TaxID=2675298 RepID=A0A809RNS0_9PROT|nr:hypothetical protein SFSGTM_11690 [Sulfuriferula nivalis]
MTTITSPIVTQNNVNVGDDMPANIDSRLAIVKLLKPRQLLEITVYDLIFKSAVCQHMNQIN